MDDLQVLPEIDPDGVNAARDRLAELRAALQSEWHANGDEVAKVLRTTKQLNGNIYRKVGKERALAAVQAVVDAPGLLPELPEKFELLTTPKLENSTNRGCTAPSARLFDLCAECAELYARWVGPRRALLLTEARRYLRDTLDRTKRDERVLYFDDLLRRMDQALQGDGGDDLAEAIRKRYRVAMIDEFQDTDPQQYRIFRRVFGGSGDRGLLFCGDPKQAIYAFRGADVFTYMTAKVHTPREACYTLKDNWRSSTRLIRALNRLFDRPAAPFIFDKIAYEEIDPSPKADDEPLLIDGTEPAPLQFRMLRVTPENATKRPEGFIAADAARGEAATYCAERVAELLNLAGEGRASIGGERLKPSDIALLVRSHTEGNQVQEALRRCNVGSVVMSQESVLAGEDAEALDLVLTALADLHDEKLVRAALGSGLLGRDAAILDSLVVDEVAWENLLARLQSYREAWAEHGFIPGFQKLLDGEGVPARLLARQDGERRLTNLLQLGELLQVASREHSGLAGLLAWLREQRQAEEREDARRVRDDARQLRLESDEGLVKVVTMHKSKGLEYPVVFVPFPWSHYQGRDKPPPLFHDRPAVVAQPDLSSGLVEEEVETDPVFDLAAGTQVGDLLHRVFETIDFPAAGGDSLERHIVDYKSNRLGRALRDYDRDSMAEAIRRHRYDLQYLLYTVALHRFLGQRLAGYEYAQHFGGVYYLFLRGMRPQKGPAYGVWADRPALTLVERLDVLFAGKKEVA
jgi:exodeoxyribonuclease V beta subunit